MLDFEKKKERNKECFDIKLKKLMSKTWYDVHDGLIKWIDKKMN